MSRVHLGARQLLRQLQADGWRIERTPQHHLKCFAPDGRTLITSSGRFEGRGADRQNLRNFLRDLRVRAGWQPHE